MAPDAGHQRQVEGRHPVLEALRSGVDVREVLVAQGVREHGVVSEILGVASARGVRVRRPSRRELDARASGPAAQGVIAVLPPFRYASADAVVARAGDDALLAVALDGVTDPHNLGAIARSVEAAGGHGLFLPRRRTAAVSATAEKASAGALAHLPVAQVDNLARALERLKDGGVWIVSLDGAGETSLFDLELATEPLCLVVGAEGAGVSRLVAERSDVRARIPLAGRTASLNASVAAGIALFEVVRRRATASPTSP